MKTEDQAYLKVRMERVRDRLEHASYSDTYTDPITQTSCQIVDGIEDMPGDGGCNCPELVHSPDNTDCDFDPEERYWAYFDDENYSNEHGGYETEEEAVESFCRYIAIQEWEQEDDVEDLYSKLEKRTKNKLEEVVTEELGLDYSTYDAAEECCRCGRAAVEPEIGCHLDLEATEVGGWLKGKFYCDECWHPED